MKKLLALGVLLFAASQASLLAAASSATWVTDYPAALKQAKAENRHVFVLFTGSDWCPPCKALHKEVLTSSEFAKYAGEKLVLVELDFPRQKKMPASLKAQNDKLARQYGIQGYPTVIVLDSNGKKVGQLGYQPGGPGPFVARLKKL